MLDEDGDIMEGRIIKVGADVIEVDLNHELAGKTIHYVGEIVEIRDATEEELEWGFPESLMSEMFDEDDFEMAFEDDE